MGPGIQDLLLTANLSLVYDDSFTLKCNSNTPKTPLFSVFATDFRGCMESCSTWNGFGSLNDTLCEAVTYVPLWTNYDAANYSKAPGNCYLKPGPQSVSGLETPYPDLESHSAIRD